MKSRVKIYVKLRPGYQYVKFTLRRTTSPKLDNEYGRSIAMRLHQGCYVCTRYLHKGSRDSCLIKLKKDYWHRWVKNPERVGVQCRMWAEIRIWHLLFTSFKSVLSHELQARKTISSRTISESLTTR
nr:hypothetical protein CFP56_13680 [Quercus suber]